MIYRTGVQDSINPLVAVVDAWRTRAEGSLGQGTRPATHYAPQLHWPLHRCSSAAGRCGRSLLTLIHGDCGAVFGCGLATGSVGRPDGRIGGAGIQRGCGRDVEAGARASW